MEDIGLLLEELKDRKIKMDINEIDKYLESLYKRKEENEYPKIDNIEGKKIKKTEIVDSVKEDGDNNKDNKKIKEDGSEQDTKKQTIKSSSSVDDRKKKELKKNVILLIITILVTLIFLEIFLRMFSPQKIYNECYEQDPENSSTWENQLNQYIGWFPSPNYSRCFYQPDTNKIFYKTHNSKGIRLNKEIPYEKGDKKRVVLLGDSMVYGFGLNDSDTIAVRLQENLGEDYEVIPIAASGYSTGQEALLLKEGLGYEPEALKYDPDIVILFFFMNDFENNLQIMHAYGDQPILDVDKDGIIQIKNFPTKMEWMKGYGPKIISLSRQDPISSFLLKYSHLYSVWFHKKSTLKFYSKKKSYLNNRTSDGYDAYIEKNLSLGTAYKILLVTKVFDEIESISQEKNFKFIVVNIPYKTEVSKKYQKIFLDQWYDVDESYFEFKQINNIFTEVLPAETKESEYSIEYISLHDLAEEHFDEFYFKTDPHWNPQGIKLSADYITNELKNRKII